MDLHRTTEREKYTPINKMISDMGLCIIKIKLKSYTLVDINGKELYNGCIIEAMGSDKKPCRHIVLYNNAINGYIQYLFMAQDIVVKPFDCGLLTQEYINNEGKYIVGDIIDNPELLTSKY